MSRTSFLPEESLAELQAGRSGVDQDRGSGRNQKRGGGGDGFFGRAVAHDAFLEGDFGPDVAGIEHPAVDADDVSGLFQLGQIAAQGGR